MVALVKMSVDDTLGNMGATCLQHTMNDRNDTSKTQLVMRRDLDVNVVGHLPIFWVVEPLPCTTNACAVRPSRLHNTEVSEG